MVIRANLIVGAFAVWLLATSPAMAATIGSDLAAAPNDSVCNFKPNVSSPGETETRYCSVTQYILDDDYAAPDRLEAPFNGTVVGCPLFLGPVTSTRARIGPPLGTHNQKELSTKELRFYCPL